MDRKQQVIEFLSGRDWTSPGVIGASVWGKGHHSASASPVCKRLVEIGKVERNTKGHYRLMPNAEVTGLRREEDR